MFLMSIHTFHQFLAPCLAYSFSRIWYASFRPLKSQLNSCYSLHSDLQHRALIEDNNLFLTPTGHSLIWSEHAIAISGPASISRPYLCLLNSIDHKRYLCIHEMSSRADRITSAAKSPAQTTHHNPSNSCHAEALSVSLQISTHKQIQWMFKRILHQKSAKDGFLFSMLFYELPNSTSVRHESNIRYSWLW